MVAGKKVVQDILISRLRYRYGMFITHVASWSCST